MIDCTSVGGTTFCDWLYYCRGGQLSVIDCTTVGGTTFCDCTSVGETTFCD